MVARSPLFMIMLVPLLPLLGAIIIATFRRSLKGNSAGMLGTLTIGSAFALSVMLFLGHDPATGPQIAHLFDWIHIGGMNIPFAFQVDALSLTMMLIVTGVGTLIHLYSIGYMHDDARVSTFFALLNLFTFAMLVLVMGANYVMTFIGWEGVGLCSYLLIGFWYTTPAYNYAARKAFVMNRIGDQGFVLGLAWLFSLTGTLNFNEVFDKASSLDTATLTGITLLLFVGAIGKSAQLPLFTWLPDAMAGPTPVSALIHAATMVTAGIYLIVRSSVLFELAPFTQDVILYTGLITALVAATIGVFQNDIKKVLAYSTVSQLGYMFVALGLGAYSAGLFHVTTHAFFKALLFLGAGSVIHALGGEQDIRKMGGLKGSIKVTYVTFLLGTLAISGLFPFSGFFSKDAILAHAFDRSPVLYALLLGGALITTFYMFRLLFLTFFGSYRGDKHPHESPAVMTVPLMVLAVLSVVGGLLNLPHVFGGHEPMKHYLESAAEGVSSEYLHLSATTEWTLMGLSTVLVLLVIFIAYGRFAKKATLDPEADQLSFFPRLFARKWYIDELYEMLFEKPYGWFSSKFSSIGEDRVMVPLMNGAGRVTQKAGQVLRLVQTGNMSFYLFAMVAGIIVFLIMTLYGV
ncbi:MAG: NADH-quinone oxidoreductase subunit L [Flavobacteriales bacterium]|nr:NADH-quinone oxidoreductase subunit L [Flavobacteriales bacterium]